MKNYKFIVERTQNGFSAFTEDENLPVTTTGKDFDELKKKHARRSQFIFGTHRKKNSNSRTNYYKN